MTSPPAFMDESQARDEICRVGRSVPRQASVGVMR